MASHAVNASPPAEIDTESVKARQEIGGDTDDERKINDREKNDGRKNKIH